MVLVVDAHQLIDELVIAPDSLTEELPFGAAGDGIAGPLTGVETTRASGAAKRPAIRRNAFAFLNRLLRHNPPHALSLIHAKANRLAEDVPEQYRSDVQAIQDCSESITALAKRIRTFGEVLSGRQNWNESTSPRCCVGRSR